MARHNCSPKRKRPNPVFAKIKDDPKLPRVLLLGDSISIGYTLPTRALMKGVANVHRAPTNLRPNTRGLEQIDSWLGGGKWDVIHFNLGLHDLKYIDDKGRLTKNRLEKIQRPANLHFTPDGSRTLAEEVVRQLRGALGKEE